MTDIKKYINTSNIGFFIFPIIIFGLYFSNPFSIFVKGNELSFVFVIISCFTIEYFIKKAKDGQKIYMRPIPAMKAMEEAVGRSTEMGTSVLYVPGISGLDQIDTISGLTMQNIGKIGKKNILEVEICQMKWCKIKYGKNTGWVNKLNLWGLYEKEIIDLPFYQPIINMIWEINLNFFITSRSVEVKKSL